MKIEKFKEGDVVGAWFDTGAGKMGGARLEFAVVKKVGAKRVLVRGEHGSKAVWKNPAIFTTTVKDPELFAEIRSKVARLESQDQKLSASKLTKQEQEDRSDFDSAAIIGVPLEKVKLYLTQGKTLSDLINDRDSGKLGDPNG